ncbi:MAG: hypothetical protein LBH98_06395 [Chitinispirillales bacterium]|jgi:hypothetical protein|nr:hypothetical protein [Chitinispirillales bacterium]
MSKLDRFVNVKYNQRLSNFSDIDYDTVVIISNTIVGKGNAVFGPKSTETKPTEPTVFTAV